MASLPLEPAHAEALQGHSSLATLRQQRIRAVLWLTLIFWISNYVLLTLATALAGSGHLDKLIPMRIGEMSRFSRKRWQPKSMLLFGSRPLWCEAIQLPNERSSICMRPWPWPKSPSSFTPLVSRLMMAATNAGERWYFFAEATIYPEMSLKNFTWAGAVRTIAFWTWFFLAWAGTYLAVSYSFDVREEQQLNAEIREQAHVAQLRALHSQINPHFLFNALNSVAALILDRKSERADEMVTKLARFLRLGLAADPTDKIALSAELELQRTYLEIEQLRYEDLVVDLSVPEALEEALVPALILQPIVENAVKYGVAGAPPPAHIGISAWADEIDRNVPKY